MPAIFVPKCREGRKCYKCGGLKNFSQECRCMNQSKPRCYRCISLGHLAQNYPENMLGGKELSPHLPAASQQMRVFSQQMFM